MSFLTWLKDHPISPRTAELQACWNAALASIKPLSVEHVFRAWTKYENVVTLEEFTSIVREVESSHGILV